MTNIKILYVDDSLISARMFSESLSKKIYDTTFTLEIASGPEEFLTKLQRFQPEVVVLDIVLHGNRQGGFQLLDIVKKKSPDLTVFMCSNLDDIETIRSCLEKGADDFIVKTNDNGTLPLRIIKALQLANLQRGQIGPAALDQAKPFAGQTMKKIAARVDSLVNSAVTTVHILGESGTGKEVIASMIGEFENKKPFVRVNCGAISQQLLESELFGHVKGAFTGADKDRKGFLQAASGGWIFLDEVACLSNSAQVALLRVLESQEVLPLGASVAQKIHVRVISASNDPLEALVASGRFRRDLWQRLIETEIFLPPLRERKGEIPELVDFFCRTMQGGPYQVDPSVLKFLQSFDWADGNVRELRNCLRSMTEFHINRELTLLSLPQRMLSKSRPSMSGVQATDGDGILVPVHLTDPQPYQYEVLSERLLAACIRMLLRKEPALALRGVAEHLAMSKSTLGRHVQTLRNKKLLEGCDI